jgi:hypothetical protein
MPIVRCDVHGRPRTTKAGTHPYDQTPRLPVGHPESGVVCGVPSCDEPGVVWLKADEAADYARGVRVFKPHTNVVKIRVQ